MLVNVGLPVRTLTVQCAKFNVREDWAQRHKPPDYINETDWTLTRRVIEAVSLGFDSTDLFSLLLPLMRSGAMTSRHVTVTSLTGSRDRPTINVANDDYVGRTTTILIAVA